MNHMQAGDIIFVKGKGFLSDAIRLFDNNGPFTHVAVAVSSDFIIEAQYSTKVQITKMTYTDIEIVDLKLSEEERDKLVHLAIELVGKWYDYLYIVGLMFNEKEWRNPNSLICTEVAISLLKSLKKIPETDMYPVVKPNEFYHYLTVDLPKLNVI